MRAGVFGAVLFALGIAGAPGCAAEAEPDVDTVPNVDRASIANVAVRHDADADAASKVVRMAGCTATFLSNTEGRVLLASALHCMHFDAPTWCTQGVRIEDNGAPKHTGKCTSIIAWARDIDIVVFEADIDHASQGRTTARLGTTTPKVGTPLAMVGYPADDERKGQLTTTEHCWTLTDHLVGDRPFADTPGDELIHHNCSTWAGNSGGPMFRAGSDDILGLPYTYRKGEQPTSLAHSAHMTVMGEFVRRFRQELDAAGVATGP